ncbi:hypothetical protein G9P44_001965 [Scheffersomyces stipitis]|nr:hypothetical protein G9P44_001965 [Scheffersomyces stipitis]
MVNEQIPLDSRIVIVGAGTFGLSTGLELLRKGYKTVTLVDPYPPPSPLSAGNDVNKIVQSTVDNKFLSELALEALQLWRNDPIYRDAFHETGIIYAATNEKIHDIQDRRKRLEKLGIEHSALDGSQDFAKVIPSLTGSDDNSSRFRNWVGFHQKKNCGWAFARLALEFAANEIRKLGGQFEIANVEELVFNQDTVIGVRTTTGQVIKGDKVVICAGAKSDQILDFENQLLAKCFTVVHIELLPCEVESLKNLPVVLNLDQGFFFEPDKKNHLKICNEFPGYINFSEDSTISKPVYLDKIPQEAEKQIRIFLKETFPNLSARPFAVTKICWCTDTSDRNFLIGTHPKHKNLILGTGDSGQGFKYMPVIGKYIASVVSNGPESLPPDIERFWRWRPESTTNRDVYDLQNRYGGSNQVKNLQDIKHWSSSKNNSSDAAKF